MAPDAVVERLRASWTGGARAFDRLETLHRNMQVEGRHFAMPLDEYDRYRTFAERNGAWLRVALELGEAATNAALRTSGLAARDVDHIVTATVTGIATPSLDARLVNRSDLRGSRLRRPAARSRLRAPRRGTS